MVVLNKIKLVIRTNSLPVAFFFALVLTTPMTARADGLGLGIKDYSEKKGPIAFQPDARSDELPGIGHMLQGLGMCVGVFFLGLFVYKRVASNPKLVGNKRIKLIERSMISAKTALVLAEIDGKQILMSVGGDNVSFHPSYSRFEVSELEVNESEEEEWLYQGEPKISPA